MRRRDRAEEQIIHEEAILVLSIIHVKYSHLVTFTVLNMCMNC